MDSLMCDEQLTMTPTTKIQYSTNAVDLNTLEVLQTRLQSEWRNYNSSVRNSNYLVDVQTHGMDATWRFKMCRWMFQTGAAFDMTKDSVACAIYFMDQYVSQHSVDKIMLQLVCMVCMFIASKMHETQPISMEEMDLLCEKKFTHQQILLVETQVIEALQWKMNPLVCFTVARDFLHVLSSLPSTTEDAVMTLLEAASEEYGSIRFAPSILGVAAVQLVAQTDLEPTRDMSELHALCSKLELSNIALTECMSYLSGIMHGNGAAVEQSRPCVSSPIAVDDNYVQRLLPSNVNIKDCLSPSPPSDEVYNKRARTC